MGGVVGGVVVGGSSGRMVGGVVVPPVQAPRSFHSDGVAAGFQPAPGYAVWVTSAWYSWPL